MRQFWTFLFALFTGAAIPAPSTVAQTLFLSVSPPTSFEDIDYLYKPLQEPFPTRLFVAARWTANVDTMFRADISLGGGVGVGVGNTFDGTDYRISESPGGISGASIHGRLLSTSLNGATASVSISFGGYTCGGGSSGLENNPRSCDEEECEKKCETEECVSERTEQQAAGANLLGETELAVPVVQEHGFSDYLFAHNEATTTPHEPMIGDPMYVFASSDIRMTHFGLPDDLPGGDTDLTIKFEGMTHILHPREEFVFTDFVPGGVQKFYLTGFAPSEGLDRKDAAPFDFAVRFAEQGLTFLLNGAIAPGNYDLAGDVDVADYELWKSTLGSTTDLRADGDQDGMVDDGDYIVWLNGMELPGDFNFDGTIDAADYVAWQKIFSDVPQAGFDAWRANFGRTLNPSSGAHDETGSVPESLPVIAALVSTLVALPLFRPRRDSNLRKVRQACEPGASHLDVANVPHL
jgi:hypothetical protein